jgi:hypothetical protein
MASLSNSSSLFCLLLLVLSPKTPPKNEKTALPGDYPFPFASDSSGGFYISLSRSNMEDEEDDGDVDFDGSLIFLSSVLIELVLGCSGLVLGLSY